MIPGGSPFSLVPSGQQPICKVDILLIQALTIVSTPYIDVTFRFLGSGLFIDKGALYFWRSKTISTYIDCYLLLKHTSYKKLGILYRFSLLTASPQALSRGSCALIALGTPTCVYCPLGLYR